MLERTKHRFKERRNMSFTALTKITIPEEARIKEFCEQITMRCSRLQQLGQAVRKHLSASGAYNFIRPQIMIRHSRVDYQKLYYSFKMHAKVNNKCCLYNWISSITSCAPTPPHTYAHVHYIHMHTRTHITYTGSRVTNAVEQLHLLAQKLG